MRQIDEVHNSEHQRQPGRDEKEQDAELHAVEGLQQEEVEHSNTRHARARPGHPGPSHRRRGARVMTV